MFEGKNKSTLSAGKLTVNDMGSMADQTVRDRLTTDKIKVSEKILLTVVNGKRRTVK